MTIDPRTYRLLSELVEKQSLREIRRYLDYGKRVKEGVGVDELYQWIAKIALDDGQVYSLEDRAIALEIGVCELLADQWDNLSGEKPADLVLNQPVDKCAIYRLILQGEAPMARRSAFWGLFGERYKKHFDWVRNLALREDRASFTATSSGGLFIQFLAELDGVTPLAIGEGWGEVDRLKSERIKQLETMEQLQDDLEFAEDRAGRAHQQLKIREKEIKQLNKLLRQERENGEKLRSERKSRIKSQRQSGEANKELETLRREYLKMDTRLKEMAHRLAVAKGRSGDEALRVNLEALRDLDLEQLLGIGKEADDETLGRVRRRFAAAFHPDRSGDLPLWVRQLFVELLGLVNEACDRVAKK